MIVTHTVHARRVAERAVLARTPGDAVMVRAATAVALAVLRHAPAHRPLRVLLLVGPGSNGGDALHAGAALRRRGHVVTVAVTDPDRVHPGGAAALRRRGARWLPGALTPEGRRAAVAAAGGADVVVDGILGIGGRPELGDDLAALLQDLQRVHEDRGTALLVVAVDVPTGVDPDTGVVPVAALTADVTVSCGAIGTGLLVSDRAGQLELVELGMTPDGPPDAVALTDADVPSLVPGSDDDKFSGGVVGIHAGSATYPGAAVLCTGAAVSLRPGMVRFAGSSADAVVARWPEVVASPDIAAAGRVQAWAAGPGIGTDGSACADVRTVLAADVPVLLDADGLTVLAAHPELLARRVREGAPATVLTPHGREFDRLFPDLDRTDRLAAARSAAARSGAVVLLKGHRTVVAAPDGRTAVTLTGSGWLASAGSGDVLSGVIGSLLATGRDAFDAAALGAFLHGRAGDRARAAGHAGAHRLWEHLP